VRSRYRPPQYGLWQILLRLICLAAASDVRAPRYTPDQISDSFAEWRCLSTNSSHRTADNPAAPEAPPPGGRPDSRPATNRAPRLRAPEGRTGCARIETHPSPISIRTFGTCSAGYAKSDPLLAAADRHYPRAGTLREQPGGSGEGQVVIHPILPLSLTFDLRGSHRWRGRAVHQRCVLRICSMPQ